MQADEHQPLEHIEAELHAALAEFRRANGFGRAISAPQVAHSVRMIACNLGNDAVHRPDHQPFTLVNTACNSPARARSRGIVQLVAAACCCCCCECSVALSLYPSPCTTANLSLPRHRCSSSLNRAFHLSMTQLYNGAHLSHRCSATQL